MTDETTDETTDDTSISVRFDAPWRRMRGRSLHSLEGYYYDPKHGGCFRTVRRLGEGRFMILGVYGAGEARARGEFWSAFVTTGKETSGKIPMTVTFSGKIREPVVANADFVVDSKTILWDDKNRWVPCYCHPRQFVWTGPSTAFGTTGSYVGSNARF